MPLLGARLKKHPAEKVIMADVFRQVHGLDGKKDMRFDDFLADRYLPYAEANKRSFQDDVLTCRVLIEFFGKRSLRNIKADEEEGALFKAPAESGWVSHIVLFALHTGMRRGEIFNLRWFDVDLTRETVHVRQSKNGKARAVPMNATVKGLLQRLPKTSEYIFPSPKTGGRWMWGVSSSLP
jgi:integrase